VENLDRCNKSMNQNLKIGSTNSKKKKRNH